jgi:hypothetical protein
LVLIVSDGADNVSWFDRPRIFPRLARIGVVVDGIGVPLLGQIAATAEMTDWGDDKASGPISFDPLTPSTGGLAFDAKRPDLAARMSARFAALRASYILTYQPTGARPDDKGWHEVQVKLKNGKRGQVQVRAGYYEAKK